MEATLTKVTLGASILQDLVARAAKGSTMQDIIPLSCLMQVEIKNKRIYVRTTDNQNFVTTTTPDEVDAADFEIVVQTKQFAAIISKITTPTISLAIEDGKVVITGNGTYNIPLSVDADGTNIKFPQPEFTAVGGSKNIKALELKTILSLNKACKADSKETPAIFNYYMDNGQVITTNMFKACRNPLSLVETPVCLSPSLVDLIPIACNDEYGVDIEQNEDSILFSSPYGSVYGKKQLPADVEAFPAQGLIDLFKNPITQKITLSKSQLSGALDRLILFTDSIQHNKLLFTFKVNELEIVSPTTDSKEIIGYVNPITTPFESFSIPLQADYLLELLGPCGEQVSIKFDAARGIQIDNEIEKDNREKDISMVLSVLEDEE